MAINHSDLVGDGVHPPKGFETAKSGYTMIKNGDGSVLWIPVNRLPQAISTDQAKNAAPTEVEGDVYLLTGISDTIVASIVWQVETTTRLTLTASQSVLTSVSVGMYVNVSNNPEQRHNGVFLVTKVDDAGDFIEYENEDVTSGTYDDTTELSTIANFGHSSYDGCVSGDWAKYNSANDLWYSISPENFVECYNVATGTTYTHENGNWNASAADSKKSGFLDYNDVTTAETPIELTADTWATITNDGAGAFTNLAYPPTGVTTGMDTSTGAFDFSELSLGDSVHIRNDFTVTPNTNNTLLEVRYQLGAGGGVYTLETIVGRLDSGSGKQYRFSLKPDFIYMGDTNTKDNPILFQIRLSSSGEVVNAGSAIHIIRR